jgi:Flp pilus assembly protein TadD
MYREAVEDFSAVIEMEPDNVNAFFSRGLAYDNLGDGEKASLDYRAALEKDRA